MIEGVLFEASIYIIHIRKRHYFSLVRTFRNAVKNFEVKVSVPCGLGKHLITDVLVSPKSCFHPFLSYGNNP